MKWWDFTDTNFIILFSIILIALIILIFVFISFGIMEYVNKYYRNKIDQESNTTRIYLVDVKKNLVTYFNRSDIKNKKTMNLLDFYDNFHPNDAEKVKSWIFSICVDEKKVEPYLEVDILISHGHTSYFSLLKLLKYDADIGIIHIESLILKYITPINYVEKKKHGPATGVVKRSVIADIINNEKSQTGFTFALKFFHIRQDAIVNDQIERYFLMTLKNCVYPFGCNDKLNRQILEVNENELILFDLKMDNKENALQLASSIAHALKKELNLNGFTDSINFAIGVVENGQFYQDFDTILLTSEQACITAQQNNSNVYLYQRSATPIGELNKYQNDVMHLFEPDALRYLFRPIIETTSTKIIGYFNTIRAYDSPFTSFSEMSKYASRAGKNKDFLAIVSKYVINKFANENLLKSARLFFTVSMVDLPHLFNILSIIPASKSIHLVLVFEEQEVNTNSSQLDLLNNEMKRLKEFGFQLGMQVNDENLLLDPSIYLNFDYFIAGANMLAEIKKNSRARLSIHALIESLLKYKKPIIANDLESWQSIELIMKSGIEYISSDIIAASNDMLLPVEKKKLAKIKDLSNKYQ